MSFTDTVRAVPPTIQRSDSTRNQAAAVSASIAAAIEATRIHHHELPGLATLLFEAGQALSEVSFTASKHCREIIMEDGETLNVLPDTMEKSSTPLEEKGGHPSLPTVEEVLTAATQALNDFPPFVTMNARDSAPQLILENPSTVTEDNLSSENGFHRMSRKLVVRGGIRGYRMSRASHGTNNGCYYYEAIILQSKISDENSGPQMKQGLNEQESRMKHSSGRNLTLLNKHADQGVSKRNSDLDSSFSQPSSVNGHIRIGWSTRLADLQAPVGYDTHSYAVRDTMGSRINNSQREDKWGGMGFGPGDVIGFAICLMTGSDNKASENTIVDDDRSIVCSSNHIRFYKNGVPMGHSPFLDGKSDQICIAFDDIKPDKYFPAISCYMDSAAMLNFGPLFVYPPVNIPNQIKPQPFSNLCPPPPTPEEAVSLIISGKEGISNIFSKKADERIVFAFKELVKAEASVRKEAHSYHLNLHQKEICALRRERGLTTSDIEEKGSI